MAKCKCFPYKAGKKITQILRIAQIILQKLLINTEIDILKLAFPLYKKAQDTNLVTHNAQADPYQNNSTINHANAPVQCILEPDIIIHSLHILLVLGSRTVG